VTGEVRFCVPSAGETRRGFVSPQFCPRTMVKLEVADCIDGQLRKTASTDQESVPGGSGCVNEVSGVAVTRCGVPPLSEAKRRYSTALATLDQRKVTGDETFSDLSGGETSDGALFEQRGVVFSRTNDARADGTGGQFSKSASTYQL
jgi:hypothetical protein